ncbi:beta-1,4-glucosyltransferase [Rhizobiales bacterium GAS191]|nr:beta-1,4-glucosyltransferase [Rhizobiales bacterium GAS191]
MASFFPTRDILGAKVAICTSGAAIAFLLGELAARRPTRVAFANANLLTVLTGTPEGTRLLDDFLVLNDGVGLDIASKLIYGAPFPDNPHGTDLTPALLAAAPKSTRLFLFGARPRIADKAASVLAERFGLTICGTRDGYADAGDPARPVAAIRAAKADIVLVALGNPRQEQWMARHGAELGAPLVIGVGALFDFLAGVVPRAPLFIQRVRLEWLWRVAHEPRRLGKRYTIDFARFLWLVLQQRRSKR